MRQLMSAARTAILAATMSLGLSVASASDIPPLNGHRVNDLAQTLTTKEHNDLAAQLREIETKTSAQIAILTVKDLPAGETIRTYRTKVFEAWKLGTKGKDNGVLIVYAAHAADGKDHFGIEIGYGLEPVLTDSMTGDIIRKHLRTHIDAKTGKKEYFAGFTEGVKAIGEKIEAEQSAIASPKKKEDGGFAFALFGVIAIAAIGFGIAAVVMGRPRRQIQEPQRPSRRAPIDDTPPLRGRVPRQDRTPSRVRDDDDDSGTLVGAVAGAVVGAALGGDDDKGGNDTGDTDTGFDAGGGSSGGGGADD